MEKALEAVRLDKKDLRMLYELDYNARMPLSELAKRAGLSVQLARYRLENLMKKGVLRRTMAMIDYHRLGFFTYRIYLSFQNASEKDEAAIVQYFNAHPRTIWVVNCSGRWDMEVMFSARTPVEANSFLREIKKALSEKLKDYSTSPSIVNYHFERTYLSPGAERRKSHPWFSKPELAPMRIGESDFDILKMLNSDARMGALEISRRLGQGYGKVQNRIRHFEQSGLIESYRTFLDLEKIGRTFYKALIRTRGFGDSEEKRLLSFCSQEQDMAYMVECFGAWDLELEAEVEKESDFRGLLNRFKGEFSECIQDYEILHVYREHKLNYLPITKEQLFGKS
jgi:Lrp/AsnC family transcriptional regulator, leucine-responsive regulatory protein